MAVISPSLKPSGPWYNSWLRMFNHFGLWWSRLNLPGQLHRKETPNQTQHRNQQSALNQARVLGNGRRHKQPRLYYSGDVFSHRSDMRLQTIASCLQSLNGLSSGFRCATQTHQLLSFSATGENKVR
jgi:hypothetical protein